MTKLCSSRDCGGSLRHSVRFCFLVLCWLLIGVFSYAQMETATLSGTVMDRTGAVLPDVQVQVTNSDTNVVTATTTNKSGVYVVPSLKPGRYRIAVTKVGFKQVVVTDVTLNVQDVVSRNFNLDVGAVSESITVTADQLNVNTTDATVSTVIDRNFVESLPLNGRSFNMLLQLTPGVVIAPSSNLSNGQFSIDGQRTDANSFSIDGVSANFGVAPSFTLGQSGAGTAQAFSALGGTSSLVSVEALQEFRIETSSFSPEFGRSPGGQVMLATRSGTNEYHGGIYEYFRNDQLDANDWFANQAGQARAPERHNDFGGSLGGPIFKDKTFFFLSYEGARLRLPQTQSIQVPSSDARANAPTQLAPFLNAYPLPNGPVSEDGYTAQFTGTFSNSATLNAGSLRIDHVFSNRFSIFGRFNDSPSQTGSRVYGLSEIDTAEVNTKTLTVGVNMLLGSRLMNTLRGNYSTQNSTLTSALDSFGGAVPLNPGLLLGSLPSATSFVAFQTYDTDYLSTGPTTVNRASQMNFVDDLSWTLGSHQLKFGGDYRAIFLNAYPARYALQFSADSVQAFVSTGTGDLFAQIDQSSKLLTSALSFYAQDTWKPSSRLTLTYGLRWELSPPPSARGATTLASWRDVNDPSGIALAPSGTPLWSTTYRNFAPRVGLAYSLNQKNDFVLRAGWGLFYDLGLGQVATLASAFPNSFSQDSGIVPVPIADATPYLPAISMQPPYPGAYGFSPEIKLPRSYQWNVALGKSLGDRQIVSATYVGHAGRDLLRNAGYWQPNPDFSSYFYLTTNDAHSNYNALQLQFRRPLSSRLQALLSYTWSHSLDNSSNDVVSGSNTISGARDYASSDFDVRHSFSGAVTFAIPRLAKSGPLSFATKDWSANAVVVARTGFPFNGQIFVESPVLGFAYIRPDVVPGQAYWIPNPAAAGGKSLNPSAFSTPPAGQQGTEGRNDINGFGLTQVDLSIVRKFAITDRIGLKFKTDAFNLFNHPNFTNPQAFVQYGSFYLQSQKMLNQGLGGLNPVFQQGGPRSLQLSLNLTF